MPRCCKIPERVFFETVRLIALILFRVLEVFQHYQRRMNKFEGENMETVAPAQLENDERKIILVTHDESCFEVRMEGK
jgi:hypothetical protein